MSLPPLLNLADENEYRNHFYKSYVQASPVITFDSISVRFFKHNFAHSFYIESDRGSGIKDQFSFQRAKRMDWIKAVLGDSTVELYRRIMPNKSIRRIALVGVERYAVIIQIDRDGKRANFVTSYVVSDNRVIQKVRSNPKWR